MLTRLYSLILLEQQNPVYTDA